MLRRRRVTLLRRSLGGELLLLPPGKDRGLSLPLKSPVLVHLPCW